MDVETFILPLIASLDPSAASEGVLRLLCELFAPCFLGARVSKKKYKPACGQPEAECGESSVLERAKPSATQIRYGVHGPCAIQARGARLGS